MFAAILILRTVYETYKRKPFIDADLFVFLEIQASGILANMARKRQQEINYTVPPSSECSFLFMHHPPQYFNTRVNDVRQLVSSELLNGGLTLDNNSDLTSQKKIDPRDANASITYEYTPPIILEDGKAPRFESFKQTNGNAAENISSSSLGQRRMGFNVLLDECSYY